MEDKSDPIGVQSDPTAVRHLTFEATRLAEAMGLVRETEAWPLDAGSVGRLVSRAERAGVARVPRERPVVAEASSPAAQGELLQRLIGALERSPVPRYEWPSLARVFEADQLGSLLGISPSSLRRYLAGTRETPDEVAERLHFLALVVADLAGAYNDIGIRRWFERPRSLLGGKRPAALLSGTWDPEAPGPRKVRHLARSVLAAAAT